jgi:hypothetical protein
MKKPRTLHIKARKRHCQTGLKGIADQATGFGDGRALRRFTKSASAGGEQRRINELARLEHACFTKMQGIGNDYIYVDCFHERPPKDPARLSVAMADRHFESAATGSF